MSEIMTPYAAAKVANAAIVEAGIVLERPLPPQMFYNYTSARVAKGKAPLIKWTKETGIDREDLQRWLTAYIAKKGPQVADPEQAAFDASEAH